MTNLPYGFAGQWTDQNGLVHMGARYYDPPIGTFISPDPLEGGVENVMSLNRYAYAGANPVNFVDPSGMIYERPPISCGPSQQTDCNMRNTCAECVACYLDQWQYTGPFAPVNAAWEACRQVGRCGVFPPVPTPTPTSTPRPTPVPTPTRTPTLQPCPPDSLFGCYSNTATPIEAALVRGVVPGHVAADFVPENSGASNANPSWQDSFEYITVYAVVSGTVQPNILAIGDGNYRIRTDQGICYEYLHLEPIPGISPSQRSSISAGQPLGNIEDFSVDQDLDYDANLGPSHVHIAIYPCDESFRISGPQIDPTTVLNHIGGTSAP